LSRACLGKSKSSCFHSCCKTLTNSAAISPLSLSLSGGGDTSSERFSEYKIVDYSVSRKLFFYSCCPNEPWPLIKFTFKIARASSYYVRALVMPVILLTVLSFGAPFFDVKAGERLGYGVTLLLAMMAVEIITSGANARNSPRVFQMKTLI